MSAKTRNRRAATIQAAKAAADPAAPTFDSLASMNRALGAGGVPLFGGILGQRDYAAGWQGQKGYELVDRMLSRSGTIAAAMHALTAPILGGTWAIEPAKGTGATGKARADAMRDNLMGDDGLFRTDDQTGPLPFSEFMHGALLSIAYGNVPHEITFRDDGAGADAGLRWRVHSLQPRKPSTITEWRVKPDGSGSLDAIVQRHPETGADIVIPASHLLMFPWSMQWGDWRGRSIFRASYMMYELLNTLYIAAGIGAERFSSGIPMGTIHKEMTPARQAQCEAALRTVTGGHEKAYLLSIDGEFTADIKGIAGGLFPVIELIQVCELVLLRGCGMDSLAMMGTKDGSRAMSEDKTSMSFFMVDRVAKWFQQCVQRGLLVPWYRLNWGADDACPQLTYRALDTRDNVQRALAIGQLDVMGTLTRRDEIGRAARVALDIAEGEGGDEDVEGGEDGERERETVGDAPRVQLGTDTLPASATPAAGASDAASTALNGAQVASALEIVQQVAIGALPRESGISMLMAFFNLSNEQAEQIMGAVGRGFVPTEPEPAAVTEPGLG